MPPLPNHDHYENTKYCQALVFLVQVQAPVPTDPKLKSPTKKRKNKDLDQGLTLNYMGHPPQPNNNFLDIFPF